jgi:hypothetical protein
MGWTDRQSNATDQPTDACTKTCSLPRPRHQHRTGRPTDRHLHKELPRGRPWVPAQAAALELQQGQRRPPQRRLQQRRGARHELRTDAHPTHSRAGQTDARAHSVTDEHVCALRGQTDRRTDASSGGPRAAGDRQTVAPTGTQRHTVRARLPPKGLSIHRTEVRWDRQTDRQR